MKGKLIFYLCVALLPYIVSIYAADDAERLFWTNEEKMAIDQKILLGIKINDVLRLSPNGLIKNGLYTTTVKGEFLLKPKSQEVAIIFTPCTDKKRALKHYELYTYLGSVHDPNIESYGIPKVYYFGKWTNFFIMAVTLADHEITKDLNSSNKSEEVDFLIALREFVRITKYIHSKNICHEILGLENLLFRGHRAFIIDYEMAELMRKKDRSGRKVVLLPNDNTRRRKLVRKDWKQFFVSMLVIIGVFRKTDFTVVPNIAGDYMEQIEEKYAEMLGTVFQNKPELRRVLVKFAQFIFEDKIESTNATDKELIYDYFDRIIREEIANLSPPEPVLVSWLTPDQRTAAIHDLGTIPTVNISSIPNPFGLDRIEYPEVDHSFFTKNMVRPSANTGESSGSRRRNY